MKRTMLIIIALVFALTGCANVRVDDKPTVSTDTSQPSTADPDSGVTENIPSFSYEEINYKANDPGVKCDGFYNTSEVGVSTRQQAIDRAKNECTVEYDTIDVFYDNASNIWKVVFYNAGTLGGCQDVYLDNKGVTCLIIYGE